MRPLFSRDEARAVDAALVDGLGVSSLVLMENAGRGACDAIEARFADALERVVLVGGPGQNGGDAWVVARRLQLAGVAPVAFLIGSAGQLRGDAQANWALLQTLGVQTHEVHAAGDATLHAAVSKATLLVDGLFGTGLQRPIEGLHAEVVEALDASPADVVSLDMPSGIDADSGAVLGCAVHARLTVTFAGHKRGLHQFPGVEHAGELVLADIGFAPRHTPAASVYTRRDLAHLIAPRRQDGHKGVHGHLLVVGGGAGKTGAALLCGRAAFRAGAGLVTIAAPGDGIAALEEKVVELMTTVLGAPTPEAVATLLADRRCAVVGPGLGLDDHARDWVHALVEHAQIPLVLDADALSHLAASDLQPLQRASGPRILTPHPGEAARMLGTTSPAVQANRYAAAAELQGRTGQIVVLKGARSIVASADHLHVCAEGTPALGVAGTGDVLAGAIGALCLGAGSLQEAAIGGVLAHAVAGTACAVGDRGLLASDVADALPQVLAAAFGGAYATP